MSPGRRYRDLAWILPLAGLLLFMPPYLRILSRDDQLFGIPVLHIYIFVLWLVGIILSAMVSRRLVRELAPGHDDAPPGLDRHESGPP
jgi:hypothetical protein